MVALSLAIFTCFGCSKTPVERKTVSPDDIIVDKKELSIERGGFVERRNRISNHAITEWMFHCYPSFTFEKEVSAGYPRTKVSITISKIKLTISCPVAMRTGGNSSQNLIEHEEGHFSLVKRVYERADEEARAACQKLIGEKFQGEGESEDDAINAATDKASRRLCALYTARTVAFANELSENFDQITEHGASQKPVPQALAETWAKFKKAHPEDATLAP